MTKRCLTAGVFSLLFSGLLLMGCQEVNVPQEPGAVSLSWRISPMGCNQAGVDHVQISIEGVDARVSERTVFSCGLGRALLDGVLPGRYNLTLEGVDKVGRGIFVSESLQIGVSPLTTTNLDEIRLTAKAATVDIGWYFDNGRLCAPNSIDRISVGVYDEDAFAIDEGEFDCELGVGTIADLQSGTYIIELLGMSASGASIYRGIREVSVERGEHQSFDVELSECLNDC